MRKGNHAILTRLSGSFPAKELGGYHKHFGTHTRKFPPLQVIPRIRPYTCIALCQGCNQCRASRYDAATVDVVKLRTNVVILTPKLLHPSRSFAGFIPGSQILCIYITPACRIRLRGHAAENKGAGLGLMDGSGPEIDGMKYECSIMIFVAHSSIFNERPLLP